METIATTMEWETTHAGELMIHTFGISYEVTINKTTSEMCVMRFGEVVERRSKPMLIDEYTQFLERIAERAYKTERALQ